MATSDTVLTVRGVSRTARERLKRRAAREGGSVNSLVVRLIEGQTGAVRAAPAAVFDDLDHLAGTWRAADANAFDRAVAPFGNVETALWK